MQRRLVVLLLAVAGVLAGCSKPTQVLVEAVEGSVRTEFTVWDAEGAKMIVPLGKVGTPVEVPPGRYLVTRQEDKRWVWARDLEVQKGSVATIRLGAIRVQRIDGVEDDRYSVMDATTKDWVSQLDRNGELVAAPAGSYRIHAYLDLQHHWGDVTVKEGKITELPVGALVVKTPPGVSDKGVTLHDPASGDVVAQLRPFEKPFYVRAGANRVQSYLERTVLASAVDAPAGKITEVVVGALRWSGPGPRYVLLDDGGARARNTSIENGLLIAVAPGRWKIATETAQQILGEVTVAPGAVTDAK